MKYLKRFENYAVADPINFEEVFKISEEDLGFVFADLTDKFPYIKHELSTKDYNGFTIELHDESYEDLDDEFKFFKSKVLPNFQKWIETNNLKVDNVSYKEDEHKIVIKIASFKKK